MSKKLCLLLCAVVVLWGLALRSRKIADEIGGTHVHRQTITAANIYFFERDGISLRPKDFGRNEHRMLFDFPLYQYIATAIISVADSSILVAGRLVNLSIYLFTSIAFVLLLRMLGLRWETVLIGIVCLASSPLNFMYSRAIHPDNLPILLSLVSLILFLHHLRSDRPQYVAFLIAIIAGALSTLIKNPIYFTVLLAIDLFVLFRLGPRRLLKWDVIVLHGVMAATVVFITLFSNYINYGSIAMQSQDTEWYLGWASYRLALSSYLQLCVSFVVFVLAPPAFALAIYGLIQSIRGMKARQDSGILAISWTIASVVTLGIFFGLNVLHDYYQLPYVLSSAFAAAVGAEHVFKLNQSNVFRWTVILIFIAGCIGIATQLARHSFMKPELFIAEGKLIREHTAPADLVLYCKADLNHMPEPLYFARRDGYFIGKEDTSVESIREKMRALNATRATIFITNTCPFDAAQLRHLKLSRLGELNDSVLYEVDVR